MGTLQTNNFWSGGTTLIERIFNGKTIEEIKAMTPEERKSLVTKTSKPTTGHTVSMSARTSFDIPKRMSNNKHREISSSGKTSTSFTPKSTHEVIKTKPNTLKKQSKEFRKKDSTKYSGASSANTKSINFNLIPNTSNSSNSVAGTVDYSFPAGTNPDDTYYGFDSSVYAIEIQKDGKILVGGDFGNYYSYDYPGGYYAPYLIRLNSDGTVDDLFYVDYVDGDVYSIAVQEDGKILIGGYFTYYDGNYSPYITRLNSDGTYDNTFVVGNGFSSYVNDIKIQSDGKIIVCGNFQTYNGTDSYYIVRLNSNGSLDSSFLVGDINYSFNGEVNTIKIQPDGKILAGGFFNTYANINSNYIVRINYDGTRDNTFQIGNGFNGTVYSIDLQSDGKIIVGGNFYDTGYYDNNQCNAIVRLNTDGSLNSTFGFGVYGSVYKVKVQSDDKILVGGDMSSFMPYYNDWSSYDADELIRYNADTTFDYNFYFKELLSDSVYAISLQSDGKILIGGDFYQNGDASVWPLQYFGRLNNTISPYKYSYSIQSNCFQKSKTYSMGSNTLLTPDDYYDEIIVTAKEIGGGENTIIGYIIIDGEVPLFTSSKPDCEFVSKNGSWCGDAIPENYLQVRADSLLDGNWDYFSVDKRFKIGDIFFTHQVFDEDEFQVRSCFQITEIINDDYFDYYRPIDYVPYKTCEECVRANGVPYSLYNYTNENDVKIISYQKLNYSDNFFDNTTFVLLPDSNDFINFVYDSPSFPNGNDYIKFGTAPQVYSTVSIESKGDFYGTATNLMSKKGSGENNFNFNAYYGPYKGFNNWVFGVHELKNKQIMVGGFIGYYNDEPLPSYGVARLNADGSLDKTFNPNLSGGYVWCFDEQSDGKILIGGSFEGLNGIDSYNLARVDINGNIDVEFTNNIMKDGGFDGDVYSIKVLPSGEILVAGGFEYFGNVAVYGFVKLNSNGTINEKFQQNKVIFNNSVNYIYLLNSGKILLGGDFENEYDPKTDTIYNIQGLVQLNSNGSLDTNFNSSGVGFYNDDYDTYILKITQDKNGKLLVGGAFNYYNGDYVGFGLIRLNLDGTWDSSLDIGNGFNYDEVYTIDVQSDNKIIVGGWFNYYNAYDGWGAPYIFRLNDDGTPDNTFFPNKFDYGFDDPVFSSSLSNDNNLIIGGWFSNYMWNTVGDGGGVVKIFVGNEYDSYKFDLCSTVEESLIYLPTANAQSNIKQGLLAKVYKPTVGFGNDQSQMDFVFTYSTFLTSYTTSNATYISYSNETGMDEDYYALQAEGYITIPESNTYYFGLNSDDASDAYIDGTLVADWYGPHGGNLSPTPGGNQNSIYLNAGKYPIKIRLDESSGSDFVTLYYSLDGVTWLDIPDSWLSYETSGNVVKGNVNTSPSVCGSVLNSVSASTIESGSNYFDGDDYLVISNQYDEDFLLRGEDFTIEWFQNMQYNSGNPTMVSKGVNGDADILLYFANQEELYLYIKNEWYYFGYFYYLNNWSHFAITRKNNIIRLFKDGVQLTPLNSSVDFWNGQDIIFQGGLFNTNYALTIGRNSNGDSDTQFYGAITNFRWIKGTCLYDSNFDIPTSELKDVENTKVLILSKNETDLLLDSSSLNKTITYGAGPTYWVENSPFSTYYNVVASYTLFNSDGQTVYNNCNSCTETEYLTVMTYATNGGPKTIVETTQMKLSDVQRVLNYGPYFDITMGGEVSSYIYGIMNYYR